jgi:hypothetical protein
MFGLAAAVHGSIPGEHIYRSWVLINRYEQAEIVLQDLVTLRLFPEGTLACSKFMHCMQHELRLRTSCTVQKLTVPKSDCKEQEVYLRKSRKEQVNSKS